jgi:hypothetical protein
MLLAAACGDSAQDDPDGALPAADAAVQATPDVFLPGLPDARDPLDFEPAAPAAPVDATNPNSPPEPRMDASPPTPVRDCFALEPGDTIELQGELTAERTWLRIEPDASCPAARVTTREVAYAPFVLCPSERPRTLELTMLGADMLGLRDAVADPMLVVYASEDLVHDDPFDCLAANDDGVFGGLVASSARVSDLVLEPGQPATVIATSYERPEQRGLGPFTLVLEVGP